MIEDLNDFVGDAIKEILDEEKEFYNETDRDRLKVQPYTNVKRIPRNYANEDNSVEFAQADMQENEFDYGDDSYEPEQEEEA